MAKILLSGNEAIAEAAVRAGVQAYFGYPITPQTELLEYLAHRMPELDRVFIQAESELGAINMVYGAACAGVRVMTSSSSPGISLMQEGVSYIVASEVPCVLVDIMRGGPGLGNILPSQADYFQVVKGGGHGDYHPIVLAPASVQEAIDLTILAFDLADKYRHVAMVVADGNIGQMMEPAELPPISPNPLEREQFDWALTGARQRPRRVITSLYLEEDRLVALNDRIQAKQARICQNEVRYVERWVDDADLLVVAFGTAGRVSQASIKQARVAGLKVGLFRPISLWPFPFRRLVELSEQVRAVLVVEMNAGQMVEDVERAVVHRAPVHFFGTTGGKTPYPEEILARIKITYEAVSTANLEELTALPSTKIACEEDHHGTAT
jgi:2-oxoglutarate/2-oxoacid ferredoxin oxidoreductase subunit alpha